ncbi:MAG: ATP-binding cassette domain-containing protein [Steroidobacteraceae bacterium]
MPWSQERARASVDAARVRTRFISVDLEQVGLSLDGRPVLRGVDWRIRPGERWALIGRNGAGKTQLLKLLAGDVWPTAGRGRRHYLFRGRCFDEPYGVKQEIAYLGAERQDRYEHYQWNQPVEEVIGAGLYRTEVALDPLTAADRARIGALLRRLRLQALAHRRFLTLSYGERRLVLLARALASAPKLLLLDELFNGLDAVNRAQALYCLAVLSRSGLPWVLSSHRAEEVPQFATHCCELHAGRIKTQRPLHPRRVPQLLREATAGLTALARAPVASLGEPAPRAGVRGAGRTLIRLHRASVWRDAVVALRGVSLTLRAGQCWVVHGANGSGKSTLVQLLYGDLGVASGGRIERAGIVSGVPIAQFKRRVGLVAPELQAMHPPYLQVEEVVASGRDASIGRDGARGPRTAAVRAALRRVGALSLQRRTLKALSYGQLRRVLFARALVHRPDILLLDEPYTGLDAPTRARLRSLVQRAVELGVTVVIATHHRDEWPQGATHELELSRGRARYCGPLR